MGSEMCIRDSFCSVFVHVLVVLWLYLAVWHFWHPYRRRPLALRPVFFGLLFFEAQCALLLHEVQSYRRRGGEHVRASKLSRQRMPKCFPCACASRASSCPSLCRTTSREALNTSEMSAEISEMAYHRPIDRPPGPLLHRTLRANCCPSIDLLHVVYVVLVLCGRS